MAQQNRNKGSNASASALGFEATVWATADKLRGNLAAAEYNGGRALALGHSLIFLKYISDPFAKKHAELQKEKGADPEDRDFSLSASIGERAGVRCRSLAPPAGNANFAWVQHFIHHLAPMGMAGLVLASGSFSSNQSGEGETCGMAVKVCSLTD